MERAWALAEDMAESTRDSNIPRVKGFLAAWLIVLGQVAFDGGSWDLAWTLFRMGDPRVTPHEHTQGTMPLSRVAVGASLPRDHQLLLHRGKKQRRPPLKPGADAADSKKQAPGGSGGNADGGDDSQGDGAKGGGGRGKKQ